MTSADRQRKIAALRALAERPGTPAEGATARKMLERMESALPQQESGERYVDEKFEFVMNFDASLFQQAMRDAAEVMRKAGEAYYSGFQKAGRQVHNKDWATEDWHAQQRREADERIRKQRRYDDECQQQAERESRSFNVGFNVSAGDIFAEMHRTGETMGQVFNRKKAEWVAQQKAAKK